MTTTLDQVVTSKPVPAAIRKPSWKKKWREAVTGWLFIAPVMLGILIFQIGPILVSLWSSFTNWDGLTDAQFVGLANYAQLPRDPMFNETLKNTVLFTLGAIPLTVGLALALALLLETRGLKGRAFFRTAYFTPYVTSAVAIGLVWFQFYAPKGIFNEVLGWVGIAGPAWLTDLKFALPAVIVVAVWQGIGYPMVILLAGLQGIPQSLYEAARIDKASSWTQFWKITLPLLTPQLFFVLIMQFIASFQIFGIIFVMTKGGPGNATNVLIYYLYQNAFTFGRLGYASAMAWVLFIIIGAVTLIQWQLQKRWVFYDQ